MFEEKYNDDILGSNSCIDRIIITGSLGPISYSSGLQCYLASHGILLKEFNAYSEKLAQVIKENAKFVAETEGAHFGYWISFVHVVTIGYFLYAKCMNAHNIFEENAG